ncbi:MAG: TadE/TadG family type IV pilus assembly protein [Eggerthellaceae bacterium]
MDRMGGALCWDTAVRSCCVRETVAQASRGQAVVEGAFLIPIILLLLMLLIQPGILLYNYVVMKGAAADACRVIATQASEPASSVEAAIRRHLGAVPEQDNFHVHSSGCSWVIEIEGSETTSEVAVRIENQVKPLPLFDFGAEALGLTNDQGHFYQQVEVRRPVYAAWVYESEDGVDPEGWVHRDDEGMRGGGMS